MEKTNRASTQSWISTGTRGTFSFRGLMRVSVLMSSPGTVLRLRQLRSISLVRLMLMGLFLMAFVALVGMLLSWQIRVKCSLLMMCIGLRLTVSLIMLEFMMLPIFRSVVWISFN